MPLTVVGGNTIIAIIVIIWFVSGNYQRKISQIINNKLAVASILFFSTHVVGLVWTENIFWGLYIVKKMWYFLLLLPILLTITRKENIKYYISSFLIAMIVTVVLSYSVWFEIIPSFKYATASNPTPFMSHISYNPFLAFTFYLAAHKALFNKKNDSTKVFLYGLLSITISVNMFITGGRAGQVMFFVALLILIFQVYGNTIKAFFISLFSIIGIFLIAYNSSNLFHERMDLLVDEAATYQEQEYGSATGRLVFVKNSLEMIRGNLFFGIGTGDFPDEYQRISKINTPEFVNASHPHNMYILILSQLGLFGLSSLFYLLYSQIKFASSAKDKFLGDLGVVFPILFMVIMFSDSYLLGHYTTLLFVFFSSFLYKDFENS
jgi:O-antigen ligase